MPILFASRRTSPMAFRRIHDNRTPHVDAAAGAGGTESWRTGTSVSISEPCRIFMRAPRKGSSSESRLRTLLDADPAAREEWGLHRKLKSDPRITPLGSLLRNSSAD